MDEREIIQGCRDADPKAQRLLLESHSGLLYSVALRYAIDRSEAKDILQDSWIKIFKGFATYTHQGTLTAWMSRIVINTAIRKKQSFHDRNANYVETFFDEISEEPGAIEDIQYDDLLRIVNQLPDMSREVFKMAVIDGMKHREIAEVMQIEESTSRAHLSRAKKKLKEIIVQLERQETYGE